MTSSLKRSLGKAQKHSQFSPLQLIIYAVTFGALGILIYKSFATPNPNLPGDLNGDNTVSIQDLSILLSNYGTTNAAADINGDGTVGVLDLSALLSHYGQTASANPPANLGTSLPPALAKSAGSTVVGSPTQNLSSLLSSLSAGQTLQLHAGNYGVGDTSQIYLTINGTAAAPITITSYPGERAVIKQLIRVRGSYIRFSNLTFDKNSYPTDTRLGQSGGLPGGNVGIWIDAPHVTLEKSEIKNNTMSGVFGGADDVQILNNWVHDNGTTTDDHGIYIGGGGYGAIIAGNIVEHNAMFGIQIQYSSHDWIVANNTIVGNGLNFAGSGTVQAGTANNLLWVNNIAYGNKEVGYKSYVAANTLSHNLAYANPQGATYGPFGSNVSMLQSDPMFVSSSDYHLQSVSPAESAGDPVYTPPYDYDGQARANASLGALR